jgi:hypothetical protein
MAKQSKKSDTSGNLGMRAANARGEALNLSEDELAFYDALTVNDSAVEVLGEPTLAGIARELVATIKKNVTIDWTIRENIRAQLRVIVKHPAQVRLPVRHAGEGDAVGAGAGGTPFGGLGRNEVKPFVRRIPIGLSS